MGENGKYRGPICPECGCRHAPKIVDEEWFGRKEERRRCRYCGREFMFTPAVVEGDEEKPKHMVEYPVRVIHCPRCGSGNTKVASTRKPIRQHKCGDCGYAFQSRERRVG